MINFQKSSVKKKFACVLIALLAVSLVFLCSYSPFDDMPFSGPEWRKWRDSNSRNSLRALMVQDLKRMLIRKRPTPTEALSILGMPYNISNRSGNIYFWYHLGAWSDFGTNSYDDCLLISFDSNGRFLKVELVSC
jgi:hypothetical protein